MTQEEKPLTREEVLKMIEEHGGPEGLNLSLRNLSGIDLCGDINQLLDLQGIMFVAAKLQGANLNHANLRGAILAQAELQGASFLYSDLQGADFRDAVLHKVWLYGAKISQETRLDNVDWSAKYILREEEGALKGIEKYKGIRLGQALDVYRTLKQWHTQAGMYDIAGHFYFREMTVKRKVLKWWPNPLPRAWSKFLAVICGYGERPLRVVASAAVVVFGIALGIYTASALTFPSSLYHSVVSFTALGYGLGVSNVDGWVKAVGAAEAFMGVFMMALFLITFVRKMTR